MKRLLLISAVAALAVACRAASFRWGADTANSARVLPEEAPADFVPSEEYPTWDSYYSDWNNYAFAGTIGNLIKFGDTKPEGLASTYDAATGLTDLGGTLVGTHVVNEDEANGGAWGQEYICPATTINGWYMVTQYDPTTPDVFDYVFFEMTGIEETSPQFDAVTTGLGHHMHGTVLNAVQIPEPATAALLALGLVAFGLKRKVRA